jgi:ubiquinol-cytochrome c reductase cytochrome c subunit
VNQPENRRRGPWKWVVAFLVASLLGFGILIGVGCAIGANSCPFGETRQETATDGPTIFARNCAVCHGIEAQGTSTGPSLRTGPAAELSLDDLQYKIARGRPFAGMPRFKGELSEDQIEAVARYLVGLRREAAPDPEVTP